MENKEMITETNATDEIIEAVESAMELDVKKVALIGGGIGLICVGGLIIYLKRDSIREWKEERKAKKEEKKAAKQNK